MLITMPGHAAMITMPLTHNHIVFATPHSGWVHEHPKALLLIVRK